MSCVLKHFLLLFLIEININYLGSVILNHSHNTKSVFNIYFMILNNILVIIIIILEDINLIYLINSDELLRISVKNDSQ